MTTMLAVLVACGGKPSAPEHKRQGVSPRQAVADSTIYGKCVDAAMHSLAILADNGDTLHFSLEDFVQERRSEIQGGLLIDDKLAIIAEIHVYREICKLIAVLKGHIRDTDIEVDAIVISGEDLDQPVRD